MVSRIFGFIRDMFFARVFGIDSGTDAFFVAFKIPNFLRRLFAEGAFSQAFVPMLSDYKSAKNQQELKLFIDRVAGTLVLILLLVTAVGVLTAPLIIILFAPGFLIDSERYNLSVQMLRITFPYLFFISLVAFAGGILNSYAKFAVPAFTPVLLNICMIVATVWVSPLMSEPIVALAWGVLVAGMVQLCFQFFAINQLGLVPKLKIGFKDPGVKRLLNLMLPAVFGVSVTQINLLLDTIIASFLTAGSVSWLYYSDRLVELPLGLFGIALATVILPNFAKNHANNNHIEFSKSLDWALQLALLLGLPTSMGILLLAEPMLSTLFQYAEFSIADVRLAGKSLMFYAIGLPGFILVKVLVTGFTSRKDIKTPVRFGIYAMLSNMVLNIILVFPLAHAGLALATSLCAFLNAGLLLTKLLQSKIYKPHKNWANFIIKIIFANEIMSLCLYVFVDTTQWFFWTAFDRAFNLGVLIVFGGCIYVFALLLVGIRPKDLYV